MGLDLLHMVFRLERLYGIRLSHEDMTSLWVQADPPNDRYWADIRVGDLYDLVLARSRLGGDSLLDPELDAELSWSLFQHALAEALVIDAGEVTKDRWLYRDLGAE